MTFEQFESDQKTIDAVVHNFTVLGEAANHVPMEFAAEHPEIPWALKARMRNVMVHGYFGIEPRIVWATAQNDLPPLVAPLQALLQE